MKTRPSAATKPFRVPFFMLEAVVFLLFPLALVYAACRDLANYEIPNWISLVIVADFVVAAAVTPFDLSTFGWHLGAGAAVLIAGIALYARGVFGGGDAKLLAACAVWVGWAGLPQFGLSVAISGGILALVIVGLRHLRLSDSMPGRAWLQRLGSVEHGIPYAVAIGIGGVVVFKDLPMVAAFASRILEPWGAAPSLAAL